MSSIAVNGDTAPPRVAPAGSLLRTRVLAALVLAPVALALIWAGGWFFAAFVALGAALMAREWVTMTGRVTGTTAMISVAWAPVAATVLVPLGMPDWALLVVLAGVLLGALSWYLLGAAARWGALGALWIGLPCLALVYLRQLPGDGLLLVLWVMLVVWACDSLAYFAGRSIGGPKLAPRISPKKTWAGLGGGVVGAALVGLALSPWLMVAAAHVLCALGIVLAVVAQTGDLAESAVKRHFNVKDSGSLIPGHGGIWDRVDGLLFVAPMVAAFVLIGGGGPT